jgi:FADH2 O2-dependent halogenase
VSKQHFQVVVVGSGFAGSLMAMIAHRLGLSTVLIERGRHPRFAIGESSTPLANLLLEEISEQYALPFVRPLCKWGTWQKQLPQLACGLKRGFTFYRHDFGRPLATEADHRHELLVGASPNEEVADTHWYRAEFDHYLVIQAQNVGVTYWDETVLVNCHEQAKDMYLSGTRHAEPMEITADFVIDGTGPRGFLHRALELPEKPFSAFPRTQALFSHFQNVGDLPQKFFEEEQAPYPPEQAAVHHIFPGGWIWVLKFNNGITSAGVAATDEVANELKFSSGEPAWRRLLERMPSLDEVFGSARAVVPFVHSPHLAFRSGVVAGSRWALLPSAAGFVDPLLSTGSPLTLLGITRIAELLKSGLGPSDFQQRLDDYAELTALELETTSRLVGSLYASMERFDLFKELSLLYFAAASYSETVRRLGKAHLAYEFLLCRHPVFARQLREICEAVHEPLSTDDIRQLGRTIRETIEPFDLAGLADKSRHSWYPAMPSDLLLNARKVGATENEMLNLLDRCGLRPD